MIYMVLQLLSQDVLLKHFVYTLFAFCISVSLQLVPRNVKNICPGHTLCQQCDPGTMKLSTLVISD